MSKHSSTFISSHTSTVFLHFRSSYRCPNKTFQSLDQNKPQPICNCLYYWSFKPVLSLKGSQMVIFPVKPGDKVYKCHMCDKTFKQAASFNGHYQSHFGAKPFKCEICGTGRCSRWILWVKIFFLVICFHDWQIKLNLNLEILWMVKFCWIINCFYRFYFEGSPCISPEYS